MEGGRSQIQADLVIVDDFLPTDLSAFRWVEYSHYMERYDFAILSTEGWNRFRAPLSWEDALAQSPIAADKKWRVQKFPDNTLERADLGYVTFLANAWSALPWFRATATPFVMQLYPGGGFRLDDPTSDRQLEIIRESGLCRRVIATQTVTRDYLTDKRGWPADEVVFIYGGVFRPALPFDFDSDKRFYPADKATLDVCFVAMKYGTDLSAKGYDAFVAVAEDLVSRGPDNVRFHVVGSFCETDIPLSPSASERMAFYGRLEPVLLARFFRQMDVIVSMNQPFTHVPGSFDGFPTGGCQEAGLQGVVNCINDPLGLNIALVPGRDFVLVHRDPVEAADALLELLGDPAGLYAMAERNLAAYRTVFDADVQLAARTSVIDAELAKRAGAAGVAGGVG